MMIIDLIALAVAGAAFGYVVFNRPQIGLTGPAGDTGPRGPGVYILQLTDAELRDLYNAEDWFPFERVNNRLPGNIAVEGDSVVLYHDKVLVNWRFDGVKWRREIPQRDPVSISRKLKADQFLARKLNQDEVPIRWFEEDIPLPIRDDRYKLYRGTYVEYWRFDGKEWAREGKI